MRARLLTAWPALSMHFGIRPPEVGNYSAAELLAYLDALEQMAWDQRGR